MKGAFFFTKPWLKLAAGVNRETKASGSQKGAM